MVSQYTPIINILNSFEPAGSKTGTSERWCLSKASLTKRGPFKTCGLSATLPALLPRPHYTIIRWASPGTSLFLRFRVHAQVVLSKTHRHTCSVAPAFLLDYFRTIARRAIWGDTSAELLPDGRQRIKTAAETAHQTPSSLRTLTSKEDVRE